MLLNMIKQKQMFTLVLPDKIKGQYWLSDIDEDGKSRKLVSVEAEEDHWVLKSNKNVTVIDSNGRKGHNVPVSEECIYGLKLHGSDEKIFIFPEVPDENSQSFTKYVVRGSYTFTIGRNPDNTICYSNKFVSGTHARLIFNGSSWSVVNVSKSNGVYVNGYRIDSRNLDAGDLVYIMGIRIVIGSDYFAINNPGGAVEVRSGNAVEFTPQAVEEENAGHIADMPEEHYFYRPPRFYREIETAEIKIDPPPAYEEIDKVPLALMLGPSLTMGMTSVSTGFFSVMNVYLNNGSMLQAAPSLVMAGSMLTGSVLWPILTKKHEKKKTIKAEKRRQERYLGYLDEIRDTIRRCSKEQSEILNENVISPEECCNRIARESDSLWERVIGQSDFLNIRLGIGNVPLDSTVTFQDKKFTMDDDNLQDAMLSLANETKILTDVPVDFSLVKNRFVGVYGGYANVVNMVKSFVIQMIALHSYDELKVMLITDATDKDEWDFVRYIPHFWNNEKTVRFLASSDDEVKELSAYMDKAIVSRGDKDEGSDYAENIPYYVLISTGKEASERCEALQQLIKFKGNCGFSVLYMAEELKDFPKETNVVIYANGAESKMYDRNDTSGKITVFSADRINENSMESISEDIANIQLDLSSQRYALPNMITFLEMFNVSKIEHLNPLLRWKENNPCNTLQTPVGVDTSGNLFYLDLHERYHGPHGLVAGMTGSGKSEFIITYILSLAVNFHPDEVAFILIDYKGGGLTGAFEDSEKGIKLPHLAGTITNLDGAAVKRSLISIQSELRRRQAIFNEARRISNEGTMDIYKYQQLYRDGVVSEPVPHLFIISDEFAELKTQQPEFMAQLISAARIGRSLGVHLILATQKPSGVVDDQIWSNSKFRVCLKVQDKSDSQDMIKRPDAAELSQTGRFYLQVGFNEFFALGQSAWCGAEYVPTETVEKSVDESISVIDNLGRTRMKVKPQKKVVRTGPKLKQIVSIVKYLSDIAVEEEISVRPLWLDPIPEFITVEGVEKKYSKTTSGLVLSPVVGEYDDPFNQRQDALVLPISQDGNCLVYGSTGNGKTTFLTTVAYSLIKNHTADEVNIYIMDFGAETLKMFSRAPQVGGVVVSADEEETVNLLKLLTKALEDRKALFSKYGGDYASYCKNSGSTLPNIVVMINNYTGFAEQYESYEDTFNLLVRDGTKYGIYFIVTASGVNAVRFRTAQNFKIALTMQLNDASDYSSIVGRTEGVIPSKYKGRGLVSFGKVYEFQTAYCTLEDDKQQFIRNLCEDLREKASSFAVPIPVLPEKVDYEFVKASVTGLDSVPVGVAKKSLQVVSVNLDNKVIYPVAANEAELFPAFVSGLLKVISQLSFVCLVDSRNEIKSTDSFNEVIRGNYEEFAKKLFDEMVLRNNTYKDAQSDISSLEGFEKKVYVIAGFSHFYSILSDECKERIRLVLEKAESIYKVKFVICDTVQQLSAFSADSWFKRHISGAEGLWLGDGVADQYLLKINKVTRDLYEEVGDGFGYLISKNRPSLIKYLTAGEE